MPKGEKVTAIHPPDATVQLTKDVLAVPYKAVAKNISDTASLGAINSVVEQNNYTNLYLQSLGRQLSRVEHSIHPSKAEPINPKEVYKPPVQPAMLKPPPDVSNLKFTTEPEFLKELVQKLSGLSLADKKGSIATISQTREKLEELMKELSQE